MRNVVFGVREKGKLSETPFGRAGDPVKISNHFSLSLSQK